MIPTQKTDYVYVYDKRITEYDWSLHIPKKEAEKLCENDSHYYMLD